MFLLLLEDTLSHRREKMLKFFPIFHMCVCVWCARTYMWSYMSLYMCTFLWWPKVDVVNDLWLFFQFILCCKASQSNTEYVLYTDNHAGQFAEGSWLHLQRLELQQAPSPIWHVHWFWSSELQSSFLYITITLTMELYVADPKICLTFTSLISPHFSFWGPC